MGHYKTEIQGKKLKLRSITNEDFKVLYELIYGELEPEWKKWDAPYFPLERIEYSVFEQRIHDKLFATKELESWLIIEVDHVIIGVVSYYWEHRESNWLEAGIVIYRSKYWNSGYGTEAMRLWITYLFEKLPLVRIGLTTWSGNERMMKSAENLGMKLEGRLRKCRYYNGNYYDSIRMGVLKEEWMELYGEGEI